MELFIIWILATICVGLMWLIHAQAQSFKDERAAYHEHEAQILTQIQTERDTFATERRDLYDRIQSGTLPQYKQYVDDEEDEEVEDDGIAELEDAKDEITNAQQ